jgi:hypothetical protein
MKGFYRPHLCPHCGKSHDMTTGATSETNPVDGDVSICIKCGGVAVFEGRILRLPTADEQAELDKDTYVQDVLRAWRVAAGRTA